VGASDVNWRESFRRGRTRTKSTHVGRRSTGSARCFDVVLSGRQIPETEDTTFVGGGGAGKSLHAPAILHRTRNRNDVDAAHRLAVLIHDFALDHAERREAKAHTFTGILQSEKLHVRGLIVNFHELRLSGGKPIFSSGQTRKSERARAIRERLRR
jgi:hypothetical protein